jgi:DNA invertase Pin-like site-specific DNA recombinase
MLGALNPGDAVVTAKLDRLFRSAVDALNVCERLQQENVGLHMIDLGGDVTGNGISKLVFTILSAVAEAERDRIRERIRDVKADQKQRRRYLGGSRPFGYQPSPDGCLEPLEAEQAAILRMTTLRSGGLSLQAISSVIKEEFDFKLCHTAVRRVLRDA